MTQGQELAAVLAALPALYVLWRALRLSGRRYRPLGKALVVSLGVTLVVWLVVYIVLAAVIPPVVVR